MRKVVYLTEKLQFVELDKVDGKKIYAFSCKGHSLNSDKRYIYKAHRACAFQDKEGLDALYTFVCLNNSVYWKNGTHESLKETIHKALLQELNVFEFENIIEFIQWAVDGK